MNSYVIFGATGGIGSELSRKLHSRGASLMLAGRDPGLLEGLSSELDAEARPVDATSFEDVQACVSDAAESFGGLTGVVNCVGSLLLKPAHLTSRSDWEETLSTNLTSAFAVLKAGVDAMKQTGGSIVLVSSAAARIGLPNHEAIAAAKAGVIGLTRSAAASYAPRNIRVNCVAPGLVRTPMTERITGNEKTLAASTAMHALGRVGEPRDVASAIEWLLDPAQSWVTGQVIGIDGGLSTLRAR